MALTNAFYEAVKDDNVRRVRIMMKDSLLVDPTFTDFNNMVKAASSMTGLYDAHDGRAFISDEQEWNDEYMDKLMVQVVGNFSHERIDHLKQVGIAIKSKSIVICKMAITVGLKLPQVQLQVQL